MSAVAATGRYPFRDHRTIADLDAEREAQLRRPPVIVMQLPVVRRVV